MPGVKTILVTGASGLLGRAIVRMCGDIPGWRVRGTAFRRAGAALDRLDLRDRAAMRAYVDDLRPDVIVHSAAERRPDVSEKDPAATMDLNVGVTRDLTRLAAQSGAWLIYVSTDYVFDGTTPPYRPGDATHPLNAYGRGKRDGELAAREAMPEACILRIPILYGDAEWLGESAVTGVAESMLAGAAPIVCDAWAIRYPTLVDDIGVVCRGLIEHRARNPRFGGTVHWSGDEPMTKYDMAVAMAPHLGYDPAHLTANPHPGTGAPRPRDAHLDCSLLESLDIGRRTSFAQAIPAILRRHIPAPAAQP